jgi:hypothetical protein
MAVQTQLLQTITHLLAQNNNNNHRGQHRNVPEGFQKKVKNFNKLRPPTFDQSTDPMDADNWMREIEKKLELTELKEECMTMAAHQLICTASVWWDSYCDLHLHPLHIGWDEFVAEFRNHPIPEAVMDRKANKFQHLKMGGMSVQEYANCFEELMRSSTWKSAEASQRAPTRQDAQVHPRVRGQATLRVTRHSRGITPPRHSSKTEQT